MDLRKVNKVEKEAKEILARCDAVKERAKEDHMCFYGCKETSSLKRQSLELSRALSELRRT